ncbi:MAG: YccF domain-containing protein [Kangiellaceae bacterium]|jgi:uncharacterized membrane protein YccF (DUF307 family)|nr:YccF domain-containing protein [Kangiellaceae bacterium]
MSIFFNLIWIVFGGFFVFLGYVTGGIALSLTLVGIPWGFQCFKLALFALFPFGSDTRPKPYHETNDGLNIILNIIWLIFGGIWVVLCHMFWGVVLCLTIIGIPFGVQHFKMMRLGFTPFGREIYDIDDYRASYRADYDHRYRDRYD